MTDPLAVVLATLYGKRFPLETEKTTQAAIAAALNAGRVEFEREVRLSEPRAEGHGRIDLGVIDFVALPSGRGFDDRIGIEVKIKGCQRDIARQLTRYARDEDLHAIILVTARPVALSPRIGGKPIAVFDLGRAGL